MHYWWVNQNQTYKHEVGGGYLWSPKRNSNGAFNRFYDNMTQVVPGDVVFSFSDTYIKAVGIAQGKAASAPKPLAFGSAGANWGTEGWLVPVIFTELSEPIRPRDHMDVLAATLPQKYSPLRPNGGGLQSVYLATVPDDMAAVLRQLLNGQVESVLLDVPAGDEDDPRDQVEEARILNRPDVDVTEKEQLVKARRGQGLFRSRLETIEKGCRVTGVTLRAFLRASHSKPWRNSSDKEKLDGANGLLLAPHIDFLYDKGYISFGDDGSILYSSKLPPSLIQRWGLPAIANVGLFSDAQLPYLAYHRDNVFQG
jgi:putative restriction endonuclease